LIKNKNIFTADEAEGAYNCYKPKKYSYFHTKEEISLNCYFYTSIKINGKKQFQTGFSRYLQGLDGRFYDHCKYTRQLELCLSTPSTCLMGRMYSR